MTRPCLFAFGLLSPHRVCVDTKLRDNISDMIAYEKHTSDGAGQDGKQQKVKDHFEELREKQRLAQREFHQKLFNELQKEVGFYQQGVFSCVCLRSVLMGEPGKVPWLRLLEQILRSQSTSSSHIQNHQGR